MKRWNILFLFNVFLFAEANSDANRLYEDLMMTYNRIVRPVQNNSERLVVSLSLKLSQLIEVVSRVVCVRLLEQVACWPGRRSHKVEGGSNLDLFKILRHNFQCLNRTLRALKKAL